MTVPGAPPTVPPPEKIRAEVTDAVEAEPAVLAAYLFESSARRAAGPLSDVDVGVLLDATAHATEVTGRLTDVLSRRLGTDRVDLVSLRRDAPLPVRYRVLRDGTLPMCRDRAALAHSTAETVLLSLKTS